MTKPITPTPGRPETSTYIDDAGVERWLENDIKVSGDNAFRCGFGEPVDYSRITNSAKHSARASAVVEQRRKEGVDMGTVGQMSRTNDARIEGNAMPQHWAVR